MKKAYIAAAAALTILTVVTPSLAQDRQPVLTLGRPCLIADYGGNKICIIDEAGKITWQMKAQRPQDVWMLANGNVLFSHIKGVKEVVLKDNSVAWEHKVEGPIEIHASSSKDAWASGGCGNGRGRAALPARAGSGRGGRYRAG